MSTRRKLVSVLVVVVLAAVAGVASASHSWGGYHWARQSNPFTLKLGDNLTTSDWKGHLSQTSQDWNAGNSPVRTSVVAGTSAGRCKMVVGTTQVCNASYGNNGWLGLASINLASGTTHITQGTAKMNDTYFNTATYNNTNEREHVMCQEVAHTFGLDHQSTDGSSQNSCMDYFSNTGANAGSTASTKPNSHDFAELSTIYSHLDSTTTVKSMTAEKAGRSDVTNDPSTWGELVSQSKNGRESVYENWNADGSRTITHVLWTIKVARDCADCDHRNQRESF